MSVFNVYKQMTSKLYVRMCNLLDFRRVLFQATTEERANHEQTHLVLHSGPYCILPGPEVDKVNSM